MSNNTTLIEPDLSEGVSFLFNLNSEHTILMYPKNTHKSYGIFLFKQDAIGGRKLAYDSKYQFFPGKNYDIDETPNAHTSLLYIATCDTVTIIDINKETDHKEIDNVSNK